MKDPTSSRGLPECYGTGHSVGDSMCRRCSVAGACARYSVKWAARRSLAEQVYAAEEKTRVVWQEGSSDIFEVYGDLYLKHYGSRPDVRHPRFLKQWATLLGRVEAHCIREVIDPALWITAQMHGMKKWLDSKPLIRLRGKLVPARFQPNMLSPTDKACNRFEVYVGMSGRRYHRVEEDAFDGDTALGRLTNELTLAERDVGALFVASAVTGSPVTWLEAAADVEPSTTWWALSDVAYSAVMLAEERQETSRAVWDLSMAHSEEQLREAVGLSRLRAAVLVTNAYQAALADRIGFRAFTWRGLADLLARLFGSRQPALAGGGLHTISGTLWGGGRVEGIGDVP